MLSFLLLFTLVTVVFFVMSGIVFFGDDVRKAWTSYSDNRRLERERRLERQREHVKLREQGVDILQERHMELIQQRRAQRRKEVDDWERQFNEEVDENGLILEAAKRYVLGDGRQDMYSLVEKSVLDSIKQPMMIADDRYIRESIDAYYNKDMGHGTFKQYTGFDTPQEAKEYLRKKDRMLSMHEEYEDKLEKQRHNQAQQRFDYSR